MDKLDISIFNFKHLLEDKTFCYAKNPKINNALKSKFFLLDKRNQNKKGAPLTNSKNNNSQLTDTQILPLASSCCILQSM